MHGGRLTEMFAFVGLKKVGMFGEEDAMVEDSALISFT